MTAPCRERRVAEVSPRGAPIDTVSAAPLSRQSAAYSELRARVAERPERFVDAVDRDAETLRFAQQRLLPRQRCSPWDLHAELRSAGKCRLRCRKRVQIAPRQTQSAEKRSRFIHHNGIAPCSKRYRKSIPHFSAVEKDLDGKPLRRRNGNGGVSPPFELVKKYFCRRTRRQQKCFALITPAGANSAWSFSLIERRIRRLFAVYAPETQR